MIEKKIIKELKRKLGKNKVFEELEYQITYSYDATGIELLPDLVVFPENDQDIETILKIAYQHKIPVTPRGAGVGYTGGSIPVQKGIVMVFTRMNRILSINSKNMIAEVEPGVVTQQLQDECQKIGLFYPPDPASLKTSTIGGNVAENAGGPRCFKYGVTGNYVLGLEGFFVSGEKFKFGSQTIKDVAGYDVKSLLVGSEGTLVVISKIVLKLIPLPKSRVLFLTEFASLQKGAEFINTMIRSNLAPSVLEFMDRSSLAATYQYLGLDLDQKINASVLIEIDGNDIDVKERKNRCVQMMKQADIINYKVAETEAEQEDLWKIRRNISPAISKLKPKKINEDIVVPVNMIPEAVSHINELAEKFNLMIILFGHFGDGNIHTNLMIDPDDGKDVENSEKVLDMIFKYVISINGSITGEHGVGISKKPFLSYQFGEAELAVFKKIKLAFDPDDLLNPGKIL